MAIDTNPIVAAANTVSAALQDLFAFADEQIKAATGETAAIKAAIAADEASAVTVLAELADHLTGVAASITAYIADRKVAAAAPPAPAA